MTDPNKTAIAVILDESGSMGVRVSDVIGGFNTFVEEQKKQPGSATLTLTRFSSAGSVRIDYVDKPLSAVESLEKTYRPMGNTALYDAVAKTIDELGVRLEKLPEHERPGKVVVVIITDGAENDSKEYTVTQVKQKIEHQTSRYNWVFTFLGADQNAVLAAGQIGISVQCSANFSGSNSRGAFRHLSANLGKYRLSADVASMSYSADQRQDLTQPNKP